MAGRDASESRRPARHSPLRGEMTHLVSERFTGISGWAYWVQEHYWSPANGSRPCDDSMHRRRGDWRTRSEQAVLGGRLNLYQAKRCPASRPIAATHNKPFQCRADTLVKQSFDLWNEVNVDKSLPVWAILQLKEEGLAAEPH